MVIAIIGILAGLLLPVLGKAKEKARRTQCANNLRQIGLAMTAYAGDFGGWYPTGPLNTDLNVGPYLNREVGIYAGGQGNVGSFACYARYLLKNQYLGDPAVFVCPSAHFAGGNTRISVASSWQTLHWINLSYFYIVKMTANLPTKAGSGGIWMWAADRENSSSVYTPDLTSSSPENHGTDGRNVLYTDGHVAWKNSATVNDLWLIIQQGWGQFGLDPTNSPQTVGQLNADVNDE